MYHVGIDVTSFRVALKLFLLLFFERNNFKINKFKNNYFKFPQASIILSYQLSFMIGLSI